MSLDINTMVVRKRDGRLVPFDSLRIQKAIEAAFRDEFKCPAPEALPEHLSTAVQRLSHRTVNLVRDAAIEGEDMTVETIQDKVEMTLMDSGFPQVAKSYILYRADHDKRRQLAGERVAPSRQLHVTRRDGTREPLDPARIRQTLLRASEGMENTVHWQLLAEDVVKVLYDGISEAELEEAMIVTTRACIEQDTAYSYVAARLQTEVTNREVERVLDERRKQNKDDFFGEREGDSRFVDYICMGITEGRIDANLYWTFDLDALEAALDYSRDRLFQYVGAKTVADRYLLRHNDQVFEKPQWFWMRVAMGIALAEPEATRTQWAIEFYNMLSTFRVVNSTPTLFNAGTQRAQLSSCFLSTISDDIEGIMGGISDNAYLSKFAGGLGNDWTNIRAAGARIKGTNGRSQGLIPFLKIANDTAVAVNQGGKRQGALCCYLETWHLDLLDFLELRKNTGDERRRTHDMFTANWIPDLFMKRVEAHGKWTLFSPDTVPGLHDLYGRAFEQQYEAYEAQARAGLIPLAKEVDAFDLWKKMLSMLFETGHPWITFKDPSNIRNAQRHVGVVHSSNLCTEILLNTSREEVAVCNLASVNLAAHIDQSDTGMGIAEDMLEKTIEVAMRMLDNVIDVNFYTIPQAKLSNQRHRPVGLGLMGFQDALYALRLPYASDGAMKFADTITEFIAFNAIKASAKLAAERGTYDSYDDSTWSQGIMPQDTLKLLDDERGIPVDVNRNSNLGDKWEEVRQLVKQHGMRNCQVMATAPTATISNIVGATQSIEPTFQHLYVKSNLSGEFTVLNPFLVADLKELHLWDEDMLEDLKYFDGSIQEIERIPADLKELYRTSFEIEPAWLIEAAARRQKWIDMGQSLNLYMFDPDGRKLHEMYFMAWKKGLKTTYYLRTLGATSREKSTIDINKRGLQPRWMKHRSASADVKVDRSAAQVRNFERYYGGAAIPGVSLGLDILTVKEPADKVARYVKSEDEWERMAATDPARRTPEQLKEVFRKIEEMDQDETMSDVEKILKAVDMIDPFKTISVSVKSGVPIVEQIRQQLQGGDQVDRPVLTPATDMTGKACSIDNPDCEACQ